MNQKIQSNLVDFILPVFEIFYQRDCTDCTDSFSTNQSNQYNLVDSINPL